LLSSLYFFFQAEDGIRDFHVTGVQTCALPIFAPPAIATTGAPSSTPTIVEAGNCVIAATGAPTNAQYRAAAVSAGCSRATPSSKIGRASCRERGEEQGGAGSVNKDGEERQPMK